MGAPDSTSNMSGVATHSQPPPQPRSSGRKRKPVSYAEDPPGEVTEVPVKKRQRRGNAAVDDADASAPAKQTKLESPPAKEKRLKRQDLSTYFCIPRQGTSIILCCERPSTDTAVSPTPSHSLTRVAGPITLIYNSMFVIGRSRGGTDACPHEDIDIAGTTGNIYTVNISLVPSCTCPHAAKGNQCKHIVYILVRVLKAPPVLQYQLAFLRSELVEIFSKAPPIPSGVPGENDGGRKSVEGDCPICCEDFESTGDAIVWCKAACGNNVHKTCFEQWAATKGGHNVTCPYCRTPWAGDEDMLKDIVKTGEKNAEGYVNVASQLGLDSERGKPHHDLYYSSC
ncbi:E3 ubiquitin-protein ligase Zswim2 [Diplodia seriata]|uniref:E3 ubiquitin-protein ligase Zswim2 n=1 Tax=Diplodia seriata TaxID=420778 RepID=A0A1S8B7F9_9PEZI|nr:E3 ubiquitin-protein ligase Zswim2 [Diplodia seriata]